MFFVALFFTLPWATESTQAGVGIVLPTEPLLLLIAALLLWQYRLVLETLQQTYRHPVFLFTAGYTLWAWVNCLFSTMPMVSVKYTFIETLHVWVYGIGFMVISRSYPQLLWHCLSAYTASFLPLLLRSWWLYGQVGFVIDFSAAAMRPFYSDHPLYGAAIAFLLPFWLWAWKGGDKLFNTRWGKVGAALVVVLLLAGLFTSFSRAAWLSFGASVAISMLLYRFANNIKQLLRVMALAVVVAVCAVILLVGYSQKKEMVKSTTVRNQFFSAFNWTYDVANLERLNKYKCAYRMFKERPLTGFGNNTYKFKYVAYQRPEEMTRISLTDPYGVKRMGMGGNSHSDYLAALTELGLPGLLLWLGVVGSLLWYGVTGFIQYNPQLLLLAVLTSLLTFFIHTGFNNFIHADKIAALFWLSWAVVILPNRYLTAKLPK